MYASLFSFPTYMNQHFTAYMNLCVYSLQCPGDNSGEVKARQKQYYVGQGRLGEEKFFGGTNGSKKDNGSEKGKKT